MPPPTPKENVPPRPRVVGSPVSSPSPLRDGSNGGSRSVTLSPKSQRKNVKNAMAPAHVDDKPIPRVVSKEETKEEPAAPKPPAVVQKKTRAAVVPAGPSPLRGARR